MKSIAGICLSLGLSFIVVLSLTSCSTVPETGRRDLILMSASEEMALGLTAFEEMKKETPVSKDAKVNEMVQRVGKRIAGVAQLPNAQWEFVVFDSKEANAFCLPGGKVGIYTGILPITKDEEGMATVIGHEVAHAVARHGASRVSRQRIVEGLGKVVDSSTSKADPRWQKVANTVYGVGAQVGATLPHSRTQESEADEIGLLYMARAGYNPEAAVGFWQRFAEFNAKSGGNTPWFLRTHPTDETRVKQLQELMPKAKAEYKPKK